jgi:ERCC4-related helicase
MEQQLDTEIKQYRSNFDENVETVQQIEEILIKKLLATLSLPGEFYKTELNRYKQPIKQVF